MKGIASENDLYTLKTKLIEALGDGYEVEIHKEVSAAYGLIKELFDLVVFNHSDAICGIDYKYNYKPQNPSMTRFHDIPIGRYKRVGLKYGIQYYGEKHDCYFWTQGSNDYIEFTFDNIVKAVRGNQNCGARFTPDEVKKNSLKSCLKN